MTYFELGTCVKIVDGDEPRVGQYGHIIDREETYYQIDFVDGIAEFEQAQIEQA